MSFENWTRQSGDDTGRASLESRISAARAENFSGKQQAGLSLLEKVRRFIYVAAHGEQS